jgi:hypothetical protein
MNYCAAATNGALAQTHNQVADLIACVCKYTVGPACMYTAAKTVRLRTHTIRWPVRLRVCASIPLADAGSCTQIHFLYGSQLPRTATPKCAPTDLTRPPSSESSCRVVATSGTLLHDGRVLQISAEKQDADMHSTQLYASKQILVSCHSVSHLHDRRASRSLSMPQVAKEVDVALLHCCSRRSLKQRIHAAATVHNLVSSRRQAGVWTGKTNTTVPSNPK